MTRPHVAVLFPGQGAFYHGALTEVVRRYPQVLNTFDEIDHIAKQECGLSVSELLFGKRSPKQEPPLAYSLPFLQLATYGIDIAMHQLLESFGLQFDVLIGHSFGELAALVCAGAFSIAEGASIVCQRVHALQRHQECHGFMLALKTTTAHAQELVTLLANQYTVIAAENSERQTVIAGPQEAIERVEHLANQLCIRFSILDSPYPFHSPLLQPMANDFYARICHLSQKPLRKPVFSPVLRRYYRDDDLLTWCLAQHLTQKVHFQEAMLSLWSQNVRIFVECGALPTLRNLTRKIVKTGDVLATSCLDPGQGELRSLDTTIQMLAQLELLTPTPLAG